MAQVRSNDGTMIAYDRSGTGPAVVLVGGGLDDGSENAAIAAELKRHFTVYNYARRGRGGSGDTAPYAVAREVEDIQALIGVAGGSAHVFGASSGGALALEAAAAGSAIGRIAVYEVPYMTDASMAKHWSTYVDLRRPVDGRTGRGAALGRGRAVHAAGGLVRPGGGRRT